MRRIDSDALGILTKSLGLSGAGSPITELSDGIVDQALDVVPIIRRGRTVAGSAGVYAAIMSNTHAGADTQLSTVNVYDVAAGATSIWPVPIPEQFDVWVLACAMRRESGGGTITSLFSIQFPARTQGWGVDQAAAAVTQVDPVGIASWNGLIVTSTVDGNLTGGRGPYKQLGIRIPRGTGASTGTLRWSTVSSAAAVFNLNLFLGLFPVALGQDGIV